MFFQIKYSIKGNNPNFTISSSDGTISITDYLARNLDREEVSSYELVVVAEDDAPAAYPPINDPTAHNKGKTNKL